MHVVAFHKLVRINSLSFKRLNPRRDLGRRRSLWKLQALKPLKIRNFMNLQTMRSANTQAARLRLCRTTIRLSPSFVENRRLHSFVSEALYLRIAAYTAAVRGAANARTAIIPNSLADLSLQLEAHFLKNTARLSLPSDAVRAEQAQSSHRIAVAGCFRGRRRQQQKCQKRGHQATGMEM